MADDFEPASDADCFPTRGHYFTPPVVWRVSGGGDIDALWAEYEAMNLLYAASDPTVDEILRLKRQEEGGSD